MSSAVISNLVHLVEDRDTKSAKTHVILGSSNKQFSIKPGNVKDFWDTYCSAVNDPKGSVCYVAEIPQSESVLHFSFKLSFHNESLDFDSDDFIMNLVKCFQEVIMDNLDCDIELHPQCVVLKSDEYRDGENYSTDFRFQFPNCRITNEVFVNVIRRKLILNIRSDNINSLLTQQPIFEWDSIINKNITEPLPLYGSKSKSTDGLLKYHSSYDYIDDDNIDNPYLELSDVTNYSNHIHINNGLVDLSLFTKKRGLSVLPAEYWLPYLLSIYYNPTITMQKIEPDVNLAIDDDDDIQNVSGYDTVDKQRAFELLRMVSNERANNYSCWLAIGKAIINIYDGRPDGLHEWIRFTNACSTKFSAQDCKNEYNSLSLNYCNTMDSNETGINNFSIRTIEWFAMKDSRDAYNEWAQEIYMPNVMTAIDSPTHVNVAKAFHSMYHLYFVCASMEKNGWYAYGKHRWEYTEGGHLLLLKISTEFITKLSIIRTSLSRSVESTSDGTEKQLLEIKIKNLTKLIHDMGQMAFQSNIVKACKMYFYDKNFMDKIDTQYCVGVDNGVIEICPKSALYREGYPEDYITLSTRIPYRSDFNFNNPIVKEYMKWLAQIHIDDKERMFLRKHLASFLRRGNMDKHFNLWTGSEGNNSKSALQKCTSTALGDYCFDLPLGVLTEKKYASSGATPETAQAVNKLVGFIIEPGEDADLGAGKVKGLTGGDRFFTRGLYQNGKSVENSFKLVLVCNKVPKIPHADKAVKNRLINIPFESKWEYDAPESIEEQYRTRTFKRDPRHDNKIPRLSLAMLWLMVNDYSAYANEGLVIPQTIMDQTQKYWDENDKYFIFIKENIIKCEETDKHAFLSLEDLYTRFKIWHEKCYPGQKPIPDRATILYKMNIKIAKVNKDSSGWNGYRLNYEDGNNAEFVEL